MFINLIKINAEIHFKVSYCQSYLVRNCVGWHVNQAIETNECFQAFIKKHQSRNGHIALPFDSVL